MPSVSAPATNPQKTTGVVLIVDDEVDLREAVAFDFERQGHEVLSASNGVEAFEIANVLIGGPS